MLPVLGLDDLQQTGGHGKVEAGLFEAALSAETFVPALRFLQGDYGDPVFELVEYLFDEFADLEEVFVYFQEVIIFTALAVSSSKVGRAFLQLPASIPPSG